MCSLDLGKMTKFQIVPYASTPNSLHLILWPSLCDVPSTCVRPPGRRFRWWRLPSIPYPSPHQGYHVNFSNVLSCSPMLSDYSLTTKVHRPLCPCSQPHKTSPWIIVETQAPIGLPTYIMQADDLTFQLAPPIKAAAHNGVIGKEPTRTCETLIVADHINAR